MKHSKYIFLILFTLIFAISTSAQGVYQGKVVEVIDGRTISIEVQGGLKITMELQFIEVPEEKQQLHNTVKEHLKKLVLNKVVVFKTKSMSNKTTTGRVLLGEMDISEQMLRDGAAWYAIAKKKSQSDGEREVYLANEAQAKTEKRGIWSVDSLKPAWEFRVEQQRLRKEAEEKAYQRRIHKIRDEKSRDMVARRQQTSRSFTQNSYASSSKLGIEMWGKRSSSNLQGVKGFGKLREVYIPGLDANLTVADADYLNVKVGKKKLLMASALGYFETLDPSRKPNKGLMMVFILKTPPHIFADSDSLTFYGGKQKFHFKKGHLTYNSKNYQKEMLFYFVTEKQLSDLSKTKSLRFKLGKISGAFNKGFQQKIRDLLKARN